MITRVSALVHAIGHLLSRSEWMVRILGLPRVTEKPMAPGLVLIQIDGLSRSQLERALGAGKMPFLSHLVMHERYHLHTLYSGLPSTTSAVQGELFYGAETAVPAFGYRDRKSGQIFRMFEPQSAASVENEIKERGAPLLQGGSAYLDIYTGGAAESHFCPASLGWGRVLRGANPVVLATFVLMNAYSLLRTGVLLVLELVLAVGDLLRGLIDGRDFLKELKFVPTRVAICILLRELVTIGAKLDVARGLPVIHLNFLGYDEQAHRRGPSSMFAHWTLKGIDDSIARIWRAARRSRARTYDLWLYADHGQEDVEAYPKRYGRSIGSAVAEVFAEIRGQGLSRRPEEALGVETQRVRHLGGRRIQRLLPVYQGDWDKADGGDITVTAMGPVGFVYLPDALGRSERDRLATDLVAAAQIPMVLARNGDGTALVWTRAGRFRLPQDRTAVFGEAHPFLDDVAVDMLKICHHPDAGDLVICGWERQGRGITFPVENGAHGGPGPEETRAFALLPDHAILPSRPNSYLRPRDLREAALTHLGRRERAYPLTFHRSRRSPRTLRVMTYNVHSCIGMDGRLSPDRVARVIAQHEPDIVALQELDVGRRRTGRADQAHLIARHMEMAYHFHPTIQLEEERYGNAILSRLPMRLVKAGKLPGLARWPVTEPRGAMWVAVEVDGLEIQVFNTHFGLSPRERLVQVQALLGRDWLAHPDCPGPIILLGDLNAGPTSSVCRRLSDVLSDVQLTLADQRPKKTWFSPFPASRIDHILVDPGITVLTVDVPKTRLTRLASDHLPLIAELCFDEIVLGSKRRPGDS
jgi:endonuclease/exonuclease/phosphatase family metal-dependent hydrolase